MEAALLDEGWDEVGTVRRTAAKLSTPLVRFVEWLFNPRAPGIDLFLAAFAASWGGLMLFRPEIFDRHAFQGMAWMGDEVWLTFFCTLTAMHLAGLALPNQRNLRSAACLLSAWIWISVAISFARVEITTGVLTYFIVGFFALGGALYVSGQPRKAG